MTFKCPNGEAKATGRGVVRLPSARSVAKGSDGILMVTHWSCTWRQPGLLPNAALGLSNTGHPTRNHITVQPTDADPKSGSLGLHARVRMELRRMWYIVNTVRPKEKLEACEVQAARRRLRNQCPRPETAQTQDASPGPVATCECSQVEPDRFQASWRPPIIQNGLIN
ncbi:hypothetical protein OSTOST_19306 [Ostertagia ostertagi]